jgi:RNA polymerase sigma-70 factor (ECF subfamily)
MDNEYIQRTIEGDMNAFRHLVDKYKDMSFSIAMSIVKDDSIAEEVVQDAFLKSYQSLASFEHRAKFSTWLYKIVVNEGLRYLRKKKLDTVDVDLQEIQDIQLSEINNYILEIREEEQKRYINLALAQLSSNDSLVLRLFYLDEKDQNEIAEITGLTVTNIKTILHRARNRFYIILQDLLKHEVRSII